MKEEEKLEIRQHLIKWVDTFLKYGIVPKVVNPKAIKANYILKSKVKEKIEELDIQISECEYADDDIEERKQDIEKEKRLLLRDKKTLQDLLGEE